MQRLLDIIIPSRCLHCSRILPTHQHLCISCLHQLPYTHWEFHRPNQIHENFSSLKNFLGGNALLFYTHGNATYKLLHANKYYNQPQVGKFLAQLSFYKLHEIDFEAVIPIPSHSKTLKSRGYNQTYLIAESIANEFNVPVYKSCLKRIKQSSSQTKKNRKQRLSVSAENFICQQKISEKKVLFIDDVITTGGTLKACIQSFLEKNDTSFYIFCLAQAN